jgi:O-antigen/teichoic acid export membrane protein
MGTELEGSRAEGPKGAPRAAAAHADAARALTRGGVALAANGGLNAALGIVYWLVAARLFSQANVGRGSTLITALVGVSALAQMNYSRSLSGLVPRAGRHAVTMVSRVYLWVGLASIAGGLAFVILAPIASHQFAYLRSTPALIAVFVLSVPLWSVFSLEDTLLATVRRTEIVPFENGAFGLAKVALLLAFADLGKNSSFPIFASWVLPLVVIVVPINLYLYIRALPRAAASFPQLPPVDRRWVRYDFAGYLLWLLGVAPLPVLVLAVLGPIQAAAFYVPFTIASAIDALSLSLGNPLTAELARSEGRLTGPPRAFVKRVWIAVGLMSLGLLVFAPQVMLLFGERYRESGTEVLRILSLAMLPRSALFISIAVARAQARGPLILLLQAIASLGTLGLAFVLIHPHGTTGVAMAWLVASCAASAMAVLAIRPKSTAAETDAGAAGRKELDGV